MMVIEHCMQQGNMAQRFDILEKGMMVGRWQLL